MSIESTTGMRAVHISLQGLYCPCKPVFCSHVSLTGYPLHSLVSPALLPPCVPVCHQISNAVYVRIADFHKDLKMDMVTAEIRRYARKHEERLLHHENVEAIQLLDNSELLRRLQRTKPLSWYLGHSTQDKGLCNTTM